MHPNGHEKLQACRKHTVQLQSEGSLDGDSTSSLRIPRRTRDCRAIEQGTASSRAWFNKDRVPDLGKLVQMSVGSNTFRAFRNLPHQPSAIFRRWAFRQFNNEKTVGGLIAIDSQSRYDEWLKASCDQLNRAWEAGMGATMQYGGCRKLTNLLLKQLMWWTCLDGQRQALIGYLHVPLEKFTLVGIRNCVTHPRYRRLPPWGS